jgi:hypothetical protein
VSGAMRTGEEVEWRDVQVGYLVERFKAHGPVVETDVDPLFLAHRFEDGLVRSLPRSERVRIKRDMTEEEVEAWQESVREARERLLGGRP